MNDDHRPKISPHRNTDMICWDCQPELWKGDWIFAPITAMYCSKCKKYMDPLDQPRRPLPVLEISTFTSDRPAAQVLKELGYADPKELRQLRQEEDGKDPSLYGDGPGDYKDDNR